MDKIELKRRTQRFAINVIRFIEQLPNSRSLNVLCNQLLRCSSSVGANYRSACKGKSTADFINKIVIVEEEADESIYWLELMEESGLVNSKELPLLKKEADELTAIFTAIGKTAKANQQNNKSKNTAIGKSEIEIPKSEIK
ncbi:MAG TPA: four helix bundle protein [Mucilaginibacter sp.]|nr:four helix bundle protein [Mucilaginibacter sp.]